MNKKLFARAAFAGAALLAAALPAQAVPITYTLQDVRFEDGASATGSFTFDANTGTASDWTISVSEGFLSSFTYHTTNTHLAIANLLNANSLLFSTGLRYINFAFDSALTNAGGTHALRTGSASYECTNCDMVRYIAAGSVTSLSAEVPEPATALLMLPAALGLFAARRRAARKAS